MLKWWIYLLLGAFLIDLIYRSFYEKKINLNSMKTKNISNEYKENDISLNYSETKKNTPSKYDKKKFDPEIIHFYSQINSEENINDDEDNDLVYPNNYKKPKKIIDEDEIEFEGLIPKPKKRINITIEYDDKYQNLYDEMAKQLDGNITYLTFYPKKIEIEKGMKILKYFLFCTMAISCICCAFIEKIIELCCSGMPEGLKKFISIIKFFLSGGSYLFHMYFIKKISHTNLFEVYVEKELKYSTLKRDEPPTYVILFNIIKSMQKKE